MHYLTGVSSFAFPRGGATEGVGVPVRQQREREQWSAGASTELSLRDSNMRR